MRWHVVVPGVSAGALGAAALTLAVLLRPGPSTTLAVLVLVAGACLGVITATHVWAVEKQHQDARRIEAKLDALGDRLQAEIRAGNAYDRIAHDLPSSPRLRSVKPS
ncbi:hypothetical protein SUDANB95_05471 [Actinosynnema sp. ALI-1.44]